MIKRNARNYQQLKHCNEIDVPARFKCEGEAILTYEWGKNEECDVLAKQLRKLVNDAWSSPSVTSIKGDWEGFIGREKNAIKNLQTIQSNLQRAGITEYEKALMQLVFYLFLAEGGFTNYMNFVCLLLTSQGHDLYNHYKYDPKKRYAHSLEEIAEVNTYTKELFLEEHDFKLFNTGLDRKLRNIIAHNNFEVKNDGTIINTINCKQIDIWMKVPQILDFLVNVRNTLINESLKFLH